MKKELLKQFWVAFKIWAIALAVNTGLGCLYLVGYFENMVMLIGLVYGAIFSLPVLIILLIVLNHCVSRRKNGLEIFQYVLLFGICLSLIAAVFFMVLFPGTPQALLMIAVVSAVAAIGSQYYALFRLAKYDNEYEKFLS